METQNQETIKKKNYPQVIAKALLKIILGLLIFVVVLVGGLSIALRFPAVQTKVAQKAASILSQTIDHQVTIGHVDIKFFKRVILNEVRVLDYKKETLFYIGQADADIGVFSIFHPNKLYISSLTLTKPEANLIQYQGSDTLNMSTFIRSLGKLIKSDTTQPKKPFDFKLEQLILQNGHFTYHNYNKRLAEYGLDYSHLDLERISGKFSELNVKGDSIQVLVQNLTTQDKRSKTYLKDLDTRMTYHPKFWEWAELNLRLNKSHLAKYVRFDYDRFLNFTKFNDSVEVTANLDSTYVTTDDISMFATVMREWDEKALVSAELKGKTKNFRAKNVDIRYGKYTHITGEVSADGLPDFKNTFADLHLGNSTINARDVRHFLPKQVYDIASRAGTIKLHGEFTGFYNDFVANGDFNTALGKLTSDINLKFDKKDPTNSSYRGYLKTNGFDVGGLLGDRSVIKTVSMAGRVTGNGFSLDKAKLQIDATINAINVNHYNFQNIVVDADLSRQIFDGDISIKDPNVVLAASGKINLQNNQQIFDLKARLEKANLRALGLTNQQVYLETDADVDFTGYKLDEIFGSARFHNTRLRYGTRTVNVDSLSIVSHFHGGIRELHVESELLSLQVGGNFKYTTFYQDLKTLYKEYRMNLKNNPTEIANYYNRKSSRAPSSYEVDLRANMRNITPVLQAFVPELTLSKFSTVEGTFRNGPTAIFSLVGTVDTLKYAGYELYHNNIEVNTSKLWNNPEVLANTLITSQRQKHGNVNTENVYLEGVWSERKITFSSNIAQTGTTNRARISGNVAFEEDDVVVAFNRSQVNILDKEWTISPNNTITFDANAIKFDNVTLSYGTQSLKILGALSRNPNEQLKVQIQDFRLQNLNPLMSMKMDGRVNGELMLRNVYKDIALTSQMRVDSLMMDNIFIGNVDGITNWDNQQHNLDVDVSIGREGQKVLSLTGTYNPKGGDQQLNMLAVMDDAQLKLVEPVLSTIMSDLGGTMAGRVQIQGRLNAPTLKGSVLVSDGAFVFTYLKTKYTFADRVFFNEDGITFRSIKLRDIYNNTATVTGGVYHNGFQNMVIDLKATFNRFMVLNTTKNDNTMYYGTAFATGQVTALGPTDNLQVDVRARSENNTSISVPLNNATSIERNNYITFVNRNVVDTATTPTPEKKASVDLSGIRLNFDLDVNENAYLELIFDERTGDIIRGRGKGNIKMNIDTRGEFAMYGNYEIVQGRYNFTMLGLVNKEFNVRPGGTVSFNGDPLAAILDVTATYTQRVSLQPILGTNSNNDDALASASRVRYPVTAVMDLDGVVTSPQIRLNLEFNDLPNALETLISGYINDIRNDEQELNRQVFSLLAFKRLSAQNELQVGVGDLGNSVGELFSNQLSYWLSQIDNNLEVDIGVSGSGNQVLDDVQLRLSYTLLEGRLRVTREGSINNNARSATNQTASNAGDWSLEYYLSKSGQLRLRATYQTTPRDIAGAIATSRQTISVLHTSNFDHFGELFRRRRLSKKAQRAAERMKARETIESDDRTIL